MYPPIADTEMIREDNRTDEGKTGCYGKSIRTVANSPIIIITLTYQSFLKNLITFKGLNYQHSFYTLTCHT